MSLKSFDMLSPPTTWHHRMKRGNFGQIAKLGWSAAALNGTLNINSKSRSWNKGWLESAAWSLVRGALISAKTARNWNQLTFPKTRMFYVSTTYKKSRQKENYIKSQRRRIYDGSDVAYKFLLITTFKGVSWRVVERRKGKWKWRAEESSRCLRKRYFGRPSMVENTASRGFN